MKLLSALGMVWRDLRRCTRGSLVFWRYLAAKEGLSIALGVFSTQSTGVSKGQPCRYVARIANASAEAQTVTLTIDIRAAEDANRRGGRYASFAKHVKVAPRTAVAVGIAYDWLDTASFLIDEVPSPPDTFSSLGRDGPQWYAVEALLDGLGGRRLDALTIYQELQR